MNEFRGYVEGNKSAAVRIGDLKSGMKAIVDTAELGVEIHARFSETLDKVTFDIYLNEGTSGHARAITCLGRVTVGETDGRPHFTLDKNHQGDIM